MEHPLKHLRKATGRTQEEMARLLKTSAATISRWENGQRQPEPERVPEISQITGIPRHLLRPDVYREPAS